MRQAFYRLLGELRISHHRVHDRRHTVATLMLVNGANPMVVQERLGHSTVSLTRDTYSSVRQASMGVLLSGWRLGFDRGADGGDEPAG